MKKLTRRDVFGYLSSGGVGLAIGSAIDMGKATNPNPKILLLRGEVAQSFKDISALKAAKIMAPDGVAQVGGGEQAGNYKWLVGDYAAEVVGDPAGQEYIESSVVDATVGVWKKIDQGVVDRLAPAYLKTVSDIMNSGEVSLLRFIDRSKHSGLKDGTNTDDMAPAINEAMSSEARRLTMTWGSLNVAGTVEIPAKKQLVGSGRGETFIKALPGFSDSWVVRLGTSADQVVTGSRLENMTVSCNGIGGLVGVYSNSINENAGLVHCAIRGVSKGLLINEANTGAGAGSPKNFIINGLEVFFDNADATSVGIDIVARYVQQMSAITVIGDFNSVVADAGIWIRSTSGLDMAGVHLE
ncbi:MAG: hypothetical protein J4A00_11195, partial [Gammaproteobacteria bacterium]|nr:hypothetical protein [Gammaproteobacteria bacterium]